MRHSVNNLLVSVVLGLLTTGLLVWINLSTSSSGLTQILIILSGMSAMATFSTLQRLVEKETRQIAVLPFSEGLLSDLLVQAQRDTVYYFERQPPRFESPPWEFNAAQLLGYDNALALAKLRMDIERELRRIAFEAAIDLSTRPSGTFNVARELTSKEILPESLLPVVYEVTGFANKAIHGAEISGDQAAAVVRVGQQLLEQLRKISGARRPN